MEAYEGFCLQSLALLQQHVKMSTSTEPLKFCSVIRFHGRPVLAPLLNGQNRQQMCDYRRRAVKLEEDRKKRKTIKISSPQSQIQNKSPDEKIQNPPPAVNGYTLVTDSPGLVVGSEPGPDAAGATAAAAAAVNEKKEKKEKKEKNEKKEKKEDEEKDLSLDFLLRRSREYVKREKTLHTEKSPDGVEFGFSLHRSPVGPAPTSLSPSLPGQSVLLPGPDSIGVLRTQKRKPRPFSTGNIQFFLPNSQSDLVLRSPVKSGVSPGEWVRSGPAGSPEVGGAIGTAALSPRSSPAEAISPSGSSSNFRRRCHTLDSRPDDLIDRSQERLPRFMAGVSMVTPGRRGAATRSHCSPPVLRSCPTPDLQAEVRDPHGRVGVRSGAGCHPTKLEENQWLSPTVEVIQRRLEDEHALQMSRLLAEQEKEQQRLLQELEEAERRRAEQERMRFQAVGDGGRGYWTSGDGPAVSPPGPRLSPSHTFCVQSPGPGIVSPVMSGLISPSLTPPVFLRGPNWNKSRSRLSQVPTWEQQKGFSRIGAITRGFLTRRLLKTDKVRNLRQTVADTLEFINSFHSETPQKATFSAQDLTLHERVKAQLRAALFDIHEIFFEIPPTERLALLQVDRELRAERKLREVEKAKCLRDRGALSSATQRSLDRKRRVGESPVPTRKMQQKPKSPTTSRSWYRKTPEERLRRSDHLKKQNSLG